MRLATTLALLFIALACDAFIVGVLIGLGWSRTEALLGGIIYALAHLMATRPGSTGRA